MTSRLALYAAVAVTVLLAPYVGASAQTYEVIPLVPGSAFHGVYVADVFAYRTVDGATGEVSEPARMHAAGVTLEYPMSATARGDEVILSSWFTGTVQVIDRKTGATREMMHDFKAPHDAVRLADGSILVSDLGSKSLIRASGEHGKDRNVVVGGLEGPVGLVGGAKRDVYVTEAFAGQLCRIGSNGEKTVIAKDLKMPEGIALTPDGKLIVAEVGAKRIVEIDPQTGKLTEVAGNLPIGLPAHRADCRPTFRPASGWEHQG